MEPLGETFPHLVNKLPGPQCNRVASGMVFPDATGSKPGLPLPTLTSGTYDQDVDIGVIAGIQDLFASSKKKHLPKSDKE